MKKATLFFALVFFIFSLQAQVAVDDSLSLGANYSDLAFYNLSTADDVTAPALDWDIQIWNELMSSSIRVNDGAGVMLYQLTAGDDTTDWNSVDTTGMAQLYNADSSWEAGAFGALAGDHPDYGWGTYTGGGNLTGYRIFVIKTLNGNYKKIWIKRLVFDGSNAYYEIATGNLDNSDEQTFTISKSAYPSKSFVYYAIDSAEVKDIEPVSEDWDLVFRRYQTYISSPPPAQYYTVMGVLSHPDVLVAEARGIDVTDTNYTGLTFSENISVIGSDWKAFNTTTFQWEFEDSLSYFVLAQDNHYYKIVFTDFGGAGNGNVYFNTTKLGAVPSTATTEISNVQSLTTYPNPATDRIQTLFTLKDDANVTINVFDLAGKSRLSFKAGARAGLNNFALNVGELAQGVYLLSVNDGTNTLTYKFVKN